MFRVNKVIQAYNPTKGVFVQNLKILFDLAAAFFLQKENLSYYDDDDL